MTVDIEGTPEITVAEARRVLAGLDAGKVYKSSDLYKRYQAQCALAGRQPVSIQALGMKLRAIGCSSRRKGTGAKVRAAWLVTELAQQAQPGDDQW